MSFTIHRGGAPMRFMGITVERLTAQEAVEYGLVDNIVTSKKKRDNGK